MNKLSNSKCWLPWAVAAVLFFSLSAAYFLPQYQGEVINQHDVTQYEGMSRDIVEHKLQYGEDPQWTGAMFGGMPAYQISLDNHSQKVKSVAEHVTGFVGSPTAMILFAMLNFYLMLLIFGVNPWIGIIPAIAYGFSTYSIIIIGAGHITKMWAFAYAPMLVGAVYYTLRRGNLLLGGALSALFASLELSVNHPQITYYFCIVIAALWINELVGAVRAGRLKRFAQSTAVLIFAAAVAVGSNWTSLYYTMFKSADTTRGGSELVVASDGKQSTGLDLDYATAWSYGKAESFNMFIPNLMGGSSEGGFAKDGEVAGALTKYNARSMATSLPAYWGDQPMTAGPTYIGAVMFFLAVLGLFVLKGREKWWVLIVGIFALFLAWGSNMMWFTELMFNVLPGYNKFRTVSMTLVVVQWCVPFLAAIVLARIWNADVEREKLLGGVKWSFAITAGTALIFLLLGSTMFEFSSAIDSQLPDDVAAAMRSERASMLKMDALRSLLFVIASAATVVAFAFGKIKKWLFALVLGVLVCWDLIPVDLRFLSHDKFVAPSKTEIVPTEVDKEIMADKEPGYRVANLSVNIFNDATTSYFHRSVGGYHGAKLSRYQDLIDRYLSKMNMDVYNMLNTKYFIATDPDSGELRYSINDEANGAAWFVDSLVWVDGAEEEITALGNIDNKHVAVVDRRFENQLGDVNNVLNNVEAFADTISRVGAIELKEYYPNRLVYDYSSEHGGVAVFSEIYAEGWTAYIDGTEVPHGRADYVLRAMNLPAGDHQVEFRFRAPDFDKVSGIGSACSWLIWLALAAGVVLSVAKCRKDDKQGGKQEA